MSNTSLSSSTVQNYRKIANTPVSGSHLLASLTGPDVQALEFNSKINMNPIVQIGAGPTGALLDSSQLVHATISALLVDTATQATGILNLGPDTVGNAKRYVDFFNLKSTNDTRVLKFVLTNTTGNVFLQNSSATYDSVNVKINGASSAEKQLLFDASKTVGQASSGVAGAERIVLISASNLNSGSQAVSFNILTSSL
jgi:hypothetical protein